ncbi:MAG: sugar ABC transporter ATP-binding protein [Oscillospiraceae bacterium]|nr:sugar ABC transporter ATP-binding protein [Oscillospiraceae bacterium]
MRIEMKNICKSFSKVQVLKDVHFSLDDGEVHALMGENGAGKSTLVKILTGVYTRDSGEVLIDDEPVHFKHPMEAEQSGIVFIHQELNTMHELTVEENMFMCKEIKGPLGTVNKRAMREKARKTINQLGIDIDPKTIMKHLSVGQQQMVEIAKALMVDAKALILDEPTAALTLSETEVLFKVINRLKDSGVSLIYITHRMEEVFEICDRVTVLRDGEYVNTKPIGETDMNDVVKMMIGREIGERYPNRESSIGDVLLEVDGLTKEGVFNDVSFTVRAGEVLGVAGLMGAGRTEIMEAIFGSLPYEKGTISLDGNTVNIRSPIDAKRHSLGFITEDRKIEGLMLEDSIGHNISINNLKRISNNGVLNRFKELSLVREAIEKLHIVCRGPKQLCKFLSGGNQQKVVFAKWIYTNPRVLILDEPTRGVDVGAKKEIYNIINELAADGVAIILVSSELPEVLGMSDRIMAIHEGKIGGIIDSTDATQESVMILCTGGVHA